MTTLFIMHGFIGAGKTTLAKKMATDTGAVRLTHDELMRDIYGANPPQEMFETYYAEVEKILWAQARDFLTTGRDVILDSGFWTREHRDRARTLAHECDAIFKIIALDVPYDEMKRRTLARTAALPPDSLFIDEPAFDSLYARFEPLQEDELGDYP